jgi:hypothetical protein
LKYFIVSFFLIFIIGCSNFIPKNQDFENQSVNDYSFTKKEKKAIKAKKVFIGMSKNALFATCKNLYYNGIFNIDDHNIYEIFSKPIKTLTIYIYLENDKVIGYAVIK